MRKVFTTPRFERRLQRFLEGHPDLEQAIEEAMTLIASDDAGSLRTHTLRGILKGCRAARISYEYRIVFVLKKGAVSFIDIGTHDDVYR